MAWRKSPPALIDRFDGLLPDDERVERRQMFGYPAAFVSGNLCMGLFQESLFLRLGERDRAALLARPGAHPFAPMPDRPMREYVVVPPALVEDDAAMADWIERAVAFVASLPPKRRAAAQKVSVKRPSVKRSAGKTAPPKRTPRKR